MFFLWQNAFQASLIKDPHIEITYLIEDELASTKQAELGPQRLVLANSQRKDVKSFLSFPEIACLASVWLCHAAQKSQLFNEMFETRWTSVEDSHISAHHLNLCQIQCWRQNQRTQQCSFSTRDIARPIFPKFGACFCDKQAFVSELCEFSDPTQFLWSVSGSARGSSIWICKNGIQPCIELKMESEIDVIWKCNRKHIVFRAVVVSPRPSWGYNYQRWKQMLNRRMPERHLTRNPPNTKSVIINHLSLTPKPEAL